MTLKTQISELHEQALVIDSHNDAIVAHIRRGVGVGLPSPY